LSILQWHLCDNFDALSRLLLARPQPVLSAGVKAFIRELFSLGPGSSGPFICSGHRRVTALRLAFVDPRGRVKHKRVPGVAKATDW
jgi:hypothetical protein